MPRISKIRIVGNRYDNFKKNHKNSIYDLTRNGEPDHTLFTLKNGNGKGVMMQLISQLILPGTSWGSNNGSRVTAMFYNRRRNFVPYTFHVLLEWKLDTIPERWLIAGICVTANRRSPGNGEEEEERVALQYFLYTLEHDNNGPYTLENIPAYNKLEDRAVSYDEFEGFINDNKRHFRKYSRNSSRKTNSSYYQYLKSNGIYRSEWKTIKLINKSEGGMGEYFACSSDNQAVFDNLIIPAISENMYNQSEEYRDALKEIFRSNLTITRKLPVLLAREEDYRNLLIMLEPLIEDARTGVDYQEKLRDSIEQGNNLYQTLESIVRGLGEEIKDNGERLAVLKKEKEELDFKSDNLEYARKYREAGKIEGEIKKYEGEAEALEEKLTELKEEKKSYQINQLIIPLEKAGRTRKNKVKRRETLFSSLNIGDIKEELENLDKGIIEEWEKTSAAWNALAEKHQAYLNYLTRRQDELKGKREGLEEKIRSLEVEIMAFAVKKKEHAEWENELAQRFNPLQLQAPAYLLQDLEKEQPQRLERKEEFSGRIESLQGLKQELNDERLKNQFSRKQLNNEAAGLKEGYEEREEEEEAVFQKIVRALNLDGFKEVYQKAWLRQQEKALSTQIEKKEERLTSFQKEVWENNLDLSLNEGDFWLPNNDIKILSAKIKELGVMVEYGSKFLKSLDERERGQTLQRFPLLPYGLIILQERDREIVRENLTEDFLLRSPVPVFLRQTMPSSGEDGERVFTLVNNRGSALVLDGEYYQNWKIGVASRGSQLEETVDSIKKNLDSLRRILSESRGLLNKESSLDINKKRQNVLQKHHALESTDRKLEEELSSIGEELNKLERDREKLEEKYRQTGHDIEEIKGFIRALEMFEAREKEIEKLQVVLKEYKIKARNNQEELDELAGDHTQERLEYDLWRNKVEGVIGKLSLVVEGAGLKEPGAVQEADEEKPRYKEGVSEELSLLLNKRRVLNSRLEEKDKQIGIINVEIKNLDKDIKGYRDNLRKLSPRWEEYRLDGITLHVIERRLTNIENGLRQGEGELRKACSRRDRLKGSLEALNKNINEIAEGIETRYNRAALSWVDENLALLEVKIRQASQKNAAVIDKLDKEINARREEEQSLKNQQANLNGFSKIDRSRGRIDQRFIRKLRQNPGGVLDEWMQEYRETERQLENQQQEASVHFEQFLQDLKTGVKEGMLQTKLRESFADGIKTRNFKSNLESFISMREHFTIELNSLKKDMAKAEEAREQWAERASLQVIKLIESLKEMVDKMVYKNQNGHPFPLVRLKGREQLPGEEEDVKFVLKEYFLECVEEINRTGLDGSTITDRELESYMGDQAIFSRGVRGRYPVLEVYKMTEKNEFLYARPRDYNYSSWEAINKGEGDDPEGSGGQTLSINTFVIMMLLNFRKKSIANENPWTVLMLDNPFGKASAEHVLDPIFEIADKLNFQIIAFAAPEIIKTEISERFPVFWALRIEDGKDNKNGGTVAGQVIHGGRVRVS